MLLVPLEKSLKSVVIRFMPGIHLNGMYSPNGVSLILWYVFFISKSAPICTIELKYFSWFSVKMVPIKKLDFPLCFEKMGDRSELLLTAYGNAASGQIISSASENFADSDKRFSVIVFAKYGSHFCPCGMFEDTRPILKGKFGVFEGERFSR